MAVKKQRTNGAVVSLHGRDKDGGVFTYRRTPEGGIIKSMNRDVYLAALASAKESLRKKALANG